MNDWQEQWWKQVEKTAAEMENFLVDVEEATESFVEDVGNNINSFLDDFGINFSKEIDTFVENVVEIIVTTADEIDAAISEDWNDFMDNDFTDVDFHTPSATSHPACINCINYHGHSYNGNLLVCAMHPEGWTDENCPDWEQKS